MPALCPASQLLSRKLSVVSGRQEPCEEASASSTPQKSWCHSATLSGLRPCTSPLLLSASTSSNTNSRHHSVGRKHTTPTNDTSNESIIL